MRNSQKKNGAKSTDRTSLEMLTSRTRPRLTLQNMKLKSKTRPHTERKVILHSTEEMQMLGFTLHMNDATSPLRCAAVQLRYTTGSFCLCCTCRFFPRGASLTY